MSVRLCAGRSGDRPLGWSWCPAVRATMTTPVRTPTATTERHGGSGRDLVRMSLWGRRTVMPAATDSHGDRLGSITEDAGVDLVGHATQEGDDFDELVDEVVDDS